MTRRAHLAYSTVLIAFAICAIVQHMTGTPLPPRTQSNAAQPRVAFAREPALLIPVVGVERSELRDSFGAARIGHRHAAIDIMAPRGTPAIAAVRGTIRKLDFGGAGGLTVYLADDAGTTIYYYAHLDGYAAGLHESEHVEAGQLLGYVGTTGNAPPDRPHLHFAIEHLAPNHQWSKGAAVDPYPILMASGETVGR